MSATVTLPLPKLGDVFVREVNGRRQRSLLIGLDGDGDGDWKGVVLAPNGHNFISGDRMQRTLGDWRPESWVFDPVQFTFKPPGTIWNSTFGCFIPAAAAVDASVGTGGPAATPAGVDAAQEAANAAAAAKKVVTPTSGLPEPSSLPARDGEEHYQTWKARAKQQFPVLCDHRDGEKVIAAAWAQQRSVQVNGQSLLPAGG